MRLTCVYTRNVQQMKNLGKGRV